MVTATERRSQADNVGVGERVETDDAMTVEHLDRDHRRSLPAQSFGERVANRREIEPHHEAAPSDLLDDLVLCAKVGEPLAEVFAHLCCS